MKRVEIELTSDELNLLIEALDSHRYWQLSEPAYRNDGYVVEPGSDDPDMVKQLIEAEELCEKLEEYQ